ncbi:MAG: hypothetical protein H7338_02560 [Candidatus Sericytochromatia bacterium]|nr:hypothetical protein [Candidatus Sericytochromatia bacterium]
MRYDKALTCGWDTLSLSGAPAADAKSPMDDLPTVAHWGQVAPDETMTPTRLEIPVDRDGEGRISRPEALTAIDRAVDVARYRAHVQHEPSAVCLDAHGRIVVSVPGHERTGDDVLFWVDQTGKPTHRTSIYELQGRLNLRLAGHAEGGRKSAREAADLLGAATHVATVNDGITVQGTRVLPGAAETIARTLTSPVAVTGSVCLSPDQPEGALALAFAGRQDTEALAYLDVLMAMPPAQARSLADLMVTMLHCDYNAAGRHPDKQIGAYLLVKNALHDIAFPENIGQGSVGSCAATVEQIKLAHDQPYRYLLLVHGLAGVETGVLPNGETVQANFSYTTPRHKHETRSLTACLIQNALMAYAKDQPTYNSDDDADDGLTDREIKRVHDGLFPDDHVTFARGEAAWYGLTRAIGENRYVSVGMHYSNSGRGSLHQVLVTAVSAKDITYINPWGRLETMSVARFRPRMDTVAVPTRRVALK